LAIPRVLDAAAEVAAGGVWGGAASGGADSGGAVVESVEDGVLPEALESAARAVRESGAERGELDIIYLRLVDASTVRPCPAGLRGSALLLVSATVGGTHLIDNLPLEF